MALGAQPGVTGPPHLPHQNLRPESEHSGFRGCEPWFTFRWRLFGWPEHEWVSAERENLHVHSGSSPSGSSSRLPVAPRPTCSLPERKRVSGGNLKPGTEPCPPRTAPPAGGRRTGPRVQLAACAPILLIFWSHVI